MTNQITLLHFSDLHFGEDHRFNNDGGKAKNMAQSVLESIEELREQSKNIMVAVTGDFINAKDVGNIKTNFKSAYEFLNTICIKNSEDKIDSSNVFIVPGNHDIIYEEECNKFDSYHAFYNEIYGKKPEPIEIRKYDEPKIIVAEINSCFFVMNDEGKNDKGSRGNVEQEAIDKMIEDLDLIKKDSNYNDYLKIALLHHHIVLLPPFIKKKQKGKAISSEIVNDTIINDSILIDALNDYNFHLILHGHKHHPCQYLHDPNYYWDKNSPKKPMLIISGGSCGSKELPTKEEIPCNTFNIFQISWEGMSQITIKLTVKGLQISNKEKKILPNNKWYWETIKYREFRLQHQQTNKSEWKITISNEALDTSDALIYCLRNCLLNDSDFLSTVYPDQNFNNKDLTIYDYSTLRYKYIEAILKAIRNQIQKSDFEEICKIIEYLDISEKSSADLIENVKSANLRINNFLKKYQDGNES